MRNTIVECFPNYRFSFSRPSSYTYLVEINYPFARYVRDLISPSPYTYTFITLLLRRGINKRTCIYSYMRLNKQNRQDRRGTSRIEEKSKGATGNDIVSDLARARLLDCTIAKLMNSTARRRFARRPLNRKWLLKIINEVIFDSVHIYIYFSARGFFFLFFFLSFSPLFVDFFLHSF